jgi:hypothetical protein
MFVSFQIVLVPSKVGVERCVGRGRDDDPVIQQDAVQVLAQRTDSLIRKVDEWCGDYPPRARNERTDGSWKYFDAFHSKAIENIRLRRKER